MMRHAGLQLYLSGSAVGSLRIAGTMPGVIVTAAAARNGPGTGLLTLAAGNLLCWTAPSSSAAGVEHNVAAGGSFLLEDGTDPSDWIAVQVYPAYLPASAAQAAVELRDSYNNVGPADVAAADAAAGLVTITEYALTNLTSNAVRSIALWLDASAAGEPLLAVSPDGTNYYQPTSSTDPNVLTWPSIAAGGSANVWVRRTIPASSASNPSVLNLLQWQWAGLV